MKIIMKVIPFSFVTNSTMNHKGEVLYDLFIYQLKKELRKIK